MGNFFSNFGTFKTPNELLRSGRGTSTTGTALTGEAIDSIRNLDSSYSAKLASGKVLPQSVYGAYNSLRGGIKDTAARDTTALSAGIGQKNAQIGGRLSPEQMAELQKEGEQGINDQEFSALRGVGQAQAEAELTQTNALMDRIESARNAILNAGQFQQQLGQHAQIQAMMAQLRRREAIANTFSSIFSSATKG